jgi:Holliday junction resolvasome RuvABC endonuclease subunit
MSVAKALIKSPAKTVMGIDASTLSIAFCVFNNRKPIAWGKLDIEGNDLYEKIKDARIKAGMLQEHYKPDYVCVESAVMVNSIDVMRRLAYVYGAILGELQFQGAKVVDVRPLEWQNHIGNKILTKAEKEKIKQDNPGKSASWYKNAGRKLRKQRTMDFFNKRFKINITDDNISDAVGLGFYSYYKLTRRS